MADRRVAESLFQRPPASVALGLGWNHRNDVVETQFHNRLTLGRVLSVHTTILKSRASNV